jgi:hypothetical protein
MPTQDVAFSREEVRGVEQFSKEEQEAIRQRMSAIDLLMKDQEGKGKYKIELFFTSARSLTKPTPGVISFWESGSRLHGGGDAKIYICPGKMRKIKDCEAFIPDSGNASAVLFCPKCGTSWKGDDVIGEHIARLSMKQWAALLVHYFTRMELNADIYVKHSKDDIRTVAMLETAKSKGGEALNKVRNKRAVVIYPLKNIIKDTAAGSDLYSRFTALLTA